MNFQQLILGLQEYWVSKGCLLQQPYDLEKGAGTFHPATFLRCLGPEPWKVAYVEPCKDRGRSRWAGTGLPLSPRLCAEIKRVLQDDQEDSFWSQRGRARLAELRQSLALATSEGTAIVKGEQDWEWWTFAGLAANQTVANMLSGSLGESIRASNLSIRLPSDRTLLELEQAIADAARLEEPDTSAWAEKGEELLKFSELLPTDLLTKTIIARLTDFQGAQAIFDSPIVAR